VKPQTVETAVTKQDHQIEIKFLLQIQSYQDLQLLVDLQFQRAPPTVPQPDKMDQRDLEHRNLLDKIHHNRPLRQNQHPAEKVNPQPAERLRQLLLELAVQHQKTVELLLQQATERPHQHPHLTILLLLREAQFLLDLQVLRLQILGHLNLCLLEITFLQILEFHFQ
jgi:hypothetical protein